MLRQTGWLAVSWGARAVARTQVCTEGGGGGIIWGAALASAHGAACTPGPGTQGQPVGPGAGRFCTSGSKSSLSLYY